VEHGRAFLGRFVAPGADFGVGAAYNRVTIKNCVAQDPWTNSNQLQQQRFFASLDSMISLDARKNLWAWCYGEHAFQHCKACCDYIVKEGMTREHPIYYSLNVAAHINYGKPFRRSRGIECLSAEIIPPAYRNIHEQILEWRDKMYAHTDATDNICPTHGRRLDVCYYVDGRQLGVKLLELTPEPIGAANISGLCNILIEKAVYHIKKIKNQNQSDFPKRQGDYRIGISPIEPAFTKIEGGLR
jgi:hypothetical protein